MSVGYRRSLNYTEIQRKRFSLQCQWLIENLNAAYTARIAGDDAPSHHLDEIIKWMNADHIVGVVYQGGPGAIVDSYLPTVVQSWMRDAVNHERSNHPNITWAAYKRAVDALNNEFTKSNLVGQLDTNLPDTRSQIRETVIVYAGCAHRNHTRRWAIMWGLPAALAGLVASFLWPRLAPVDVAIYNAPGMITVLVGPYQVMITAPVKSTDVLWDVVAALYARGFAPVFKRRDGAAGIYLDASKTMRWLRANNLALDTPSSPLKHTREFIV